MNMSHGQLSTLPVSDTLRLLTLLLSGRGILIYDSKYIYIYSQTGSPSFHKPFLASDKHLALIPSN